MYIDKDKDGRFSIMDISREQMLLLSRAVYAEEFDALRCIMALEKGDSINDLNRTFKFYHRLHNEIIEQMHPGPDTVVGDL